ncbi:MAG: CPBP family intramembrane metalloprotease, partial [Planctomycetota bacterium]
PAPPRARVSLLLFLFAFFVALFAEAGVGALFAPRPALRVGDATHPLGLAPVRFASDLPQPDLVWPPARPAGSEPAPGSGPPERERPEPLQRVRVRGLAAPCTLEWRFAGARLRSEAPLDVLVDDAPRSVAPGRPLDLSPGQELALGPLRARLQGPSALLLCGLTAAGKALGLLLVVALLALLGGRALLAEIGFRRPAWGAELRAGAAGLLAYLPLYGLSVALTYALGRALDLPLENHPLIDVVAREGDPRVVALVALGAVGLAPVLEELLFRGLLLQGAQRAVGRGLALLATSLAFGLMHPGFASLIPLTGLGALFGALRLTAQDRSLLSAVTAHAAFNALNLSLLVAVLGCIP